MKRPEPYEGIIVFGLPNRGLPYGWTTLTKVIPSHGLDWATLSGRYYSGYQDEFLVPGYDKECPPLSYEILVHLLVRHLKQQRR